MEFNRNNCQQSVISMFRGEGLNSSLSVDRVAFLIRSAAEGGEYDTVCLSFRYGSQLEDHVLFDYWVEYDEEFRGSAGVTDTHKSVLDCPNLVQTWDSPIIKSLKFKLNPVTGWYLLDADSY